MEQTLLDTSKYRIYSLSVDSRFASQYNNGDTSDFTLHLPSTYRNIARIALTSVELPLSEFQFSSCHGNTQLLVDVSGTGSQIAELPSGNYELCEILPALKDALNAAVPGANFDVTVQRPSGTICISSPYAFTINPVSTNATIAARPNYWGLGYYLGFRTKTPLVATQSVPAGPYSVCATTLPLLQPTPYYLLQLYAPDLLENVTHCVSAGGSVAAFAKLVLRDGFYHLQFVDGGDWLRREFTFLAPANVSQLRLRLLDPFGAPVDMRRLDWSATLELYEVVNSRTYGAMSRTYERA